MAVLACVSDETEWRSLGAAGACAHPRRVTKKGEHQRRLASGQEERILAISSKLPLARTADPRTVDACPSSNAAG